jgi:hypothetical protein
MSLLSGATRGAGGPSLARHLLKAIDGQTSSVEPSRGLASESLPEQVRELAAGAIATRTPRPLWHVHFDPLEWTTKVQNLFWAKLEGEFQLEGARYSSVKHTKRARTHEHRLYDITRDDGSVVDMRFERMRREKVAVVVAFELDLPLPPVPHLRAIQKALKAEGRPEIAEWVAGNPRAGKATSIASVTPIERAIEERRSTSKAGAADAALAAWRASDTPAAFEAALADRGLILAMGDQVPVVLDASGTAWALARLIGQASRNEGERIGVSAVRARILGLALGSAEKIRRQRQLSGIQAAQCEKPLMKRASQDTADEISSDEVGQNKMQGECRASCAVPEPSLGSSEVTEPVERDAARRLTKAEPGDSVALATSANVHIDAEETTKATKLPASESRGTKGFQLGPWGRALQEIAEREHSAFRQLSGLCRPIAPPQGLLVAQSKLSKLAGNLQRWVSREHEAAFRLQSLAKDRPVGLWPWLTGKTRRHDALIAKAAREHARIAEASATAQIVHLLAKERIIAREGAWQKRIDSIEAKRIAKRSSIEAELAWLQDAHRCLRCMPSAAEARPEVLAEAVKRLRAGQVLSTSGLTVRTKSARRGHCVVPRI